MQLKQSSGLVTRPKVLRNPPQKAARGLIRAARLRKPDMRTDARRSVQSGLENSRSHRIPVKNGRGMRLVGSKL
jgi:hypothetical protein